MYWLEQLLPQNIPDLVFTLLILFGGITTGMCARLFSRSKKAVQIFLLVLGSCSAVCTLLLTYAFWIEPNLVTTQMYTFDVPQLDAKEPIRVVVVGDFQYKAVSSPSYVGEVVQRINALKPDLVLWVGDLVEEKESELSAFSEIGNLKSSYGNFAVLGNHEYDMPAHRQPHTELADKVAEHLQEKNFTVLRNSIKVVEIKGKKIGIAGTDDLWSEKHNWQELNTAVLEQKNDFTLLLTHAPHTVLYNDKPDLYSLAVAGHCHGGQISLGFLDHYLGLPVTVQGCSKVNGKVTGFMNVNNHPIFVTPGLGTTSIRLRFLSPPEISVIDLH